ncbi:MAG: hypothetical protein ACJAVR_003117 [Paracoccaceae bacterium]|jgi:hypothetical protein
MDQVRLGLRAGLRLARARAEGFWRLRVAQTMTMLMTMPRESLEFLYPERQSMAHDCSGAWLDFTQDICN